MRTSSQLLHRARWAVRLLVTLLLVAAAFPLLTPPAKAVGPATITVTNVHADTGDPLAFSRFMITDSNGTVYGPLETLPGSGAVTFTVETVDDVTTFDILEETPPPCGIAPEVTTVGPLAGGDAIDVEIQTAFASDCSEGALSAYLYSCPDGTDGTIEDYAYFRDSCLSALNGEMFTFTTADGSQQWQPVTGAYGIAGRAPVVGLVPGDYRIIDPFTAEVVPVVYCLTYDSPIPSEAPNPSTIERKEYSDNAINVGLSGTRVACDFFVVPEQIEAEPTEGPEVTPTPTPEVEAPVESAADTAAIEVHKLTCEAGLIPEEVNLFDECHTSGLADIEFTVDGPNGFSDSGQTAILAPDGPGVVEFIDLAAGEYEINEITIPGDVVTVVTYCSLEGSDTEVERTPSDTGGIIIEVPEGERVICDWYNIPDQQFEEGAVDVVKRTCPLDFDPESSYDELVQNCSRTDDVGFVLTREGEEGVTGTTGDDGPGQVIFTELAPGTHTLLEDLPLEFLTPLAFCGTDAGNLQTVEVVNGSIELEIDGSGTTILCRWYNIPFDLQGGSGSINLEKYLCPPGASSNFAAVCGKYPLAGTTFELSGAAEGTTVTDENGLAAFDDLPAGDYTITETPPAGVNTAVYVVGCQTEGGQTFPFTYNDSTGLRIELELGEDQSITCGWYNIPPGQPEPTGPTGSITVHKMLCLGNANNQYDWDQDCETYSGGADFTLSTDTGQALKSGTTNVSGILQFTGLATGVYKLEETSAQWCHAESNRVDSNGNLNVTDGADSDVYIYNCSTKRVRSLPATGTGPGVDGGMRLNGILAGVLASVAVIGVLLVRRSQHVQAMRQRVDCRTQPEARWRKKSQWHG